ncbi:MAG: hypothetical protein U9N56_00160 [Actinomycetota bacterium]|nr:hypothetical protein [Actinomycetota bacterium]
MSHVRPEQKARKSDCRKGRHTYGESQNVGAGLLRRVCDLCSTVTIDLTQADEVTSPVLKSRSSILTMAAETMAAEQSEA